MKITLKRSNVLLNSSAKEPTASQMEYGELAVNYNESDPSIFIKDSNNQIVKVAGAEAVGNEGYPDIEDGLGATLDERYVNVTGDTMAGALSVPPGSNGTQVPQIQEVVKRTGDTMTGSLDVIGAKVTSASTVMSDPGNTLVTKDFIQKAVIGYPDIEDGEGATLDDRYVNVIGDNMVGDLTIGTNRIELNIDGTSSFEGQINNKLGGYKFPDGTVQLTAADTRDELDDRYLEDTTGSVDDDNILNGTISTESLADGAVTDDKILAGTITSKSLADDAVTTPKIEDGAVTTIKIENEAVTEDKIADDAVTTSKIQDGAVTTRKIEDGAVTEDKIAPGLLFPTGGITAFGGNTPPVGYLECNGQSTDGYSALAAVVGATVPDLRGQFIRGWDHGRGFDPDRNIRSSQSDLIKSHDHSSTAVGNHTHTIKNDGSHAHSIDSGGSHTHSINNGGSHSHTYFRQNLSDRGSGSNTTADDNGSNKNTSSAGNHNHSMNAAGNHNHSMNAAGDHNHSMDGDGSHNHTIGETGGVETRPRNFALMYIIKT
jgi:hypothetical protein